jgi:glycine dehydrogenase subunit 2
MKYNPKLNDEMARLPGFSEIHPLQRDQTVQGALRILHELQEMLGEITGLPAVSVGPLAGAHDEFTGLLSARAFHKDRGEGPAERSTDSGQRPRHESRARCDGRA